MLSGPDSDRTVEPGTQMAQAGTIRTLETADHPMFEYTGTALTRGVRCPTVWGEVTVAVGRDRGDRLVGDAAIARKELAV